MNLTVMLGSFFDEIGWSARASTLVGALILQFAYNP
jgi:hypothetical protein